MKNILIYPHSEFNMGYGGETVHYYLAQLLEEYGQIVRMHPVKGMVENHLFSNFFQNDFPIDNNCVVIYCEGITGNPLNAPNVVRWMLSRRGQNTPYNVVDSWGKNELVYFFNSEKMINDNPEKIGNIYKFLTTLYLNPNIKMFNPQLPRYNCCHTFRKARQIYKNDVNIIHPQDSHEFNHFKTHEEYVYVFNQFNFFISYDPLTFLTMMAPICGCVSIVYPMNDLNEEEWIHICAIREYVLLHNIKKLYGVSYGTNNIEWAKSTMHLAKHQWDDITQYYKKKHIPEFINDINNFEHMKNTIENVYYK